MKKLLLGFLAGVVLAVGFAALAIVGPINSVTRMFAGDGTVSAPAYSFRSQTGTGFWQESTAGRIGVSASGTQVFRFVEGGAFDVLNSSGALRLGNPVDTRIQRIGAGAVQIDNAAGGTGTLQMIPFAFVNIGSALTINGQIGYCSDCTIANPCAGAGTGALAKRLNGVNVCN